MSNLTQIPMMKVVDYVALMGITDNTVRTLFNNGEIPGKKIGGTIFLYDPRYLNEDNEPHSPVTVTNDLGDIHSQLLNTVAGKVQDLASKEGLTPTDLKALTELGRTYKILSEDERARHKYNIFYTEEIEPFLLNYIEESPEFRAKVIARIMEGHDAES